MIIEDVAFGKVKLIKLERFSDERGWFTESYSQREFASLDIHDSWPQDNTSFSKKGTIRGLHFQQWPGHQTKLVRCIFGNIWDVVVDMRGESPTYLEWRSFNLNSINPKLLYIPNGFAHGFLALTDSIVHYKCSSHYEPKLESGWHPFSKKIGIDWPRENYIISEKDRRSFMLE